LGGVFALCGVKGGKMSDFRTLLDNPKLGQMPNWTPTSSIKVLLKSPSGAPQLENRQKPPRKPLVFNRISLYGTTLSTFNIGKYIVQMESYTLIQLVHMNKAEPKQTAKTPFPYLGGPPDFPQKSQIIHFTPEKITKRLGPTVQRQKIKVEAERATQCNPYGSHLLSVICIVASILSI
jgi:hypothetical protein